MKINSLSLYLLILLVIFTYVFVFPAHFNRGIDVVNKNTGLSLPKIEERGFTEGLELQGGAYLLYEADLEKIPRGERPQRMEGLRDIIERRVDLYGIAEHSVQVRGERLAVEIPGAHDLEEAIDIIGETPFLDFREISEELVKEQEEKWKEIEEHLGKKKWEIDREELVELEGEVEGWEIVLQEPYVKTDLTGEHLDNAGVVADPVSQDPVITLEFNEKGERLFAEITSRNVGKSLATFLDGEILQEATVQEKITGGRAQITGDFSMEEAYEIARDLRIGALPVPIELVTQRSIGPTLGEDALDNSIQAGIYGFLLVALFMILVYRLPGLASVISLAIYMLLVAFLLKYIPVTITLSGMAGFLLSVGMAIDANILVLSRMREEMKKGKTIGESIEEGYLKAWSSIRDGNFTTLMVAIILFFITTSFVRGFAITLILGIVVSLFCAMIVNRILLSFFNDKMSKARKLWT